jgi:hypothetical protein
MSPRFETNAGKCKKQFLGGVPLLHFSVQWRIAGKDEAIQVDNANTVLVVPLHLDAVLLEFRSRFLHFPQSAV